MVGEPSSCRLRLAFRLEDADVGLLKACAVRLCLLAGVSDESHALRLLLPLLLPRSGNNDRLRLPLLLLLLLQRRGSNWFELTGARARRRRDEAGAGAVARCVSTMMK